MVIDYLGVLVVTTFNFGIFRERFSTSYLIKFLTVTVKAGASFLFVATASRMWSLANHFYMAYSTVVSKEKSEKLLRQPC